MRMSAVSTPDFPACTLDFDPRTLGERGRTAVRRELEHLAQRLTRVGALLSSAKRRAELEHRVHCLQAGWIVVADLDGLSQQVDPFLAAGGQAEHAEVSDHHPRDVDPLGALELGGGKPSSMESVSRSVKRHSRWDSGTPSASRRVPSVTRLWRFGDCSARM